ncbi:transcriptional regulator [Spirochaetia bacterium 38H-sp]|uniref:Transcriptional regulator n=1 Tax=Rarispira pelagica TaxID=3141764 RepID=A0ABU9UCH6_9SPIR
MEDPAYIDIMIHEPARLKIMSSLMGISEGDMADFSLLKKLTGLSDGNLSVQLRRLEDCGYVLIDKRFVGRKPKTFVSISDRGRRAFYSYVDTLEKIINAATENQKKDVK